MLKNKDEKTEKIKKEKTDKIGADTKNAEDKENSAKGGISGFTRAVPVILCAAALFLTLCFITGETGAFGSFISSSLLGLFSYMAYTIPAFIVLHAIFLFSDIKKKRLLTRVLMSLIALITLSEIAYIIPNLTAELSFDAQVFYANGTNGIGGGLIGSAVAYGIYRITGKVGLILIIALTFCLYGIFCFAGKGDKIYAFILKKLASCANFFAKIEKSKADKKKRAEEAKEEKRRALESRKNADFLEDDFFDTRNGVSRLEIPELGILETKEGAKAEAAFVPKESVTHSDSEGTAPRRTVSSYDIPTEPTFERSESSHEYRSDDIVYEEIPKKDATAIFEEADSTPTGVANRKAVCKTRLFFHFKISHIY